MCIRKMVVTLMIKQFSVCNLQSSHRLGFIHSTNTLIYAHVCYFILLGHLFYFFSLSLLDLQYTTWILDCIVNVAKHVHVGQHVGQTCIEMFCIVHDCISDNHYSIQTRWPTKINLKALNQNCRLCIYSRQRHAVIHTGLQYQG